MARRLRSEGSVFYSQSEQTWVAKITLPDGRERRKRNKDKRVVQDWRFEQLKAISENRIMPDEKMTLGDYLDRFMDDVAEHTLKPTTMHSYRYLIDSHIKPSLGRTKLIKLHPKQIQHLYSTKLNSGLSPRTVQYIHAVLRRSLNQAVRWELIYRNPTDAVTAPRPVKQAPVTLSAEQARLFLRSVNDHPLYPLYVLALTTGMRKSELLGLSWSNVDLDNGSLSVVDTLITIQGQQSMGTPKSSSAKRKLKLTDYAVEALKQHQLVSKNIDGLVFITSAGTPYSQRNVTRHFHNALEKAGLPKIRFHDLRHTFATLLLNVEGIHPKVVQEMLGHSTIVLTLDTYSHVIPSMQKDASEKIDELFKQ